LARDLLHFGHEGPAFPDLGLEILGFGSVKPVEHIPEPIHWRTERDGIGPHAKLLGLIAVPAETRQLGALPPEGTGRGRFPKARLGERVQL
jgi:hypothetical protein